MAKQQAQRQYLETYLDAITPTVAQTLNTEEIVNLSSMVDTIGGADGSRAKIHSITLMFRVTCETPFSIIPLIVQSAGTWTETVDDTTNIVDVLLAHAIDDVFGYQFLGNMMMSKRIPANDPTSGSPEIWAVETTRTIPGNILALLNKEAETERLQDVLIGYLIQNQTANKAITLYTDFLVKYSNIRKQIVIR